jgi:UV DNA damage endonuclease
LLRYTGYVCINNTLAKRGIRNNRAMIRKTFHEKGLPYASEIMLLNVQDILHILKWNEQNGVKLFRLSSDLAPWASEYEFDQLPDWPKIRATLQATGDFARAHGHRLTMHPGQFNCLTSPHEHVVVNSIKDLRIHAEIMDAMGLPRTHEAVINIHAGGAYGDPTSALDRFCKNFDRLPDCVKTRLTVENDDKPNSYSTTMLYEGITKCIGVPIIFDAHHYDYGPKDCAKIDAAELAASTWPTGCVPLFHMSSSKKIYEDSTTRNFASHADYIYEAFPEIKSTVDLDIEAKAKEAALFKFRNDFL